jgi:molybdopterin molybdotransferase
MKRIPDNLTPEEAWRRLSSVSRLPLETRELQDSLDCCLGESISAASDVPERPRSFMDGFAVRAQDTQVAPVKLRLAGEVLMGELPGRRLEQGEAMPIPTGGCLPEGADAVVMQEDTEIEGEHVRIKQPVLRDENVQTVGEDFRAGQMLFTAGHRLRAQDLAAIGTFGVPRVRVFGRPRIAVISTGNELAPLAGKGPLGARVRETNTLALTSAARKFHFSARSRGIVVDDLNAQQTALEGALKEAEVVLISGGSSVGVKDYTVQTIRSFPEYRIHFHGLAIRPGNPTVFASIGLRHVFGLPGQPVSSLIVFYQFVLPFLFHLSGESIDYRRYPASRFPMVRARLTEPVPRLKVRTQYVRVRLSREGNSLAATPVSGKSASISTLAMVDGYTTVDPGQDSLESNTVVDVAIFP